MEKKYIFVMVALVGLSLGMLSQAFVDNQKDAGYCENIEQGLRDNQSIDGSVVCSDSGSFEQQNLSNIKNKSELRCLCQYVIDGEERTFTVRETQ